MTTCGDVAVSCSVKLRPRTMGTPMESRKPLLTRSQVEPHWSPGCGAGWPCWNDALAPVVAFERAVHGHADAGHAGQCGEAVFDLAIERGQPVDGVSRAGGIKVEHVAIGGGDAEFLVFEIGERLGHEDCAGEQDERQRRLKNDESFLRKRRTIARGAIGAAQHFGRLRMGGEPCGRGTKEDAGDERDQKCKAEHGQRWAGVDGHVARVGKGERQNGARSGIGDGQSGESADATQQDALSEDLADDAAAAGAERHAHRNFSAARGGCGPACRLAMLAQAMSSTTEERIISIFRPLPVSCCRFWMPPPPGERTTCCLGMMVDPPLAVSAGACRAIGAASR